MNWAAGASIAIGVGVFLYTVPQLIPIVIVGAVIYMARRKWYAGRSR